LSYKGHNVQHCCLKYMKGGIGTQQRIHLLHCGHSYVVVNMEFFYDVPFKPGYRDASSLSFDSLCERADEQLFGKVINNTQHLLPSSLTTRAAL